MIDPIIDQCCEMLMDSNDETFENVLNEVDKILIESLKHDDDEERV